MSQITMVTYLSDGAELAYSHIADLSLMTVGGVQMLYSTTQYDGVLNGWDISAATPQQIDSLALNGGTIAGGTSPNLVPDTARAELDIRLPIGVTVAAVEAEIARLLADHPMVECSVTRRYEATWTSPSEPIASGTLAACREILPVPAAPNMRVGASDARLWRRAGMPTVVCGLTPTNLGGPDESLEVEELPVLAAILSLSVFDFLHGG